LTLPRRLAKVPRFQWLEALRMTVTIREAAPHDRERLVDLIQALNVHEDAIAGDRRRDRAAAEESLQLIDESLAERDGIFLVAEVAGEVVGLMLLVYKTDAVYLREERRPYAYVQDLVVDEKHRRLGVGRALLDAAEAAAVAAGYRRMMIGVLAGNADAEIAYARQGFRPYGHDLQKIIGSTD
jgi:ribosomal protein S18 acetylase RimI-like enzyme